MVKSLLFGHVTKKRYASTSPKRFLFCMKGRMVRSDFAVAYSNTTVLVPSAIVLIFIALGIMWIVEYAPRK